ncbi:MAG: DUF4302 domain-containing protein [Odoribacteraceae bacterium]|jgi:outer membrane biogenesis lipoprotein LolB|nr:DUF4302 domain-containing protein [Odoribacteraceae bacterium]
MKRAKIITIMSVATLLTGCSVTTDYLFDELSTHRITQYVEACDKALQEWPEGWKMVYYPDTSQYGAYTFLLDFQEGRRVKMAWDGDKDTTESAYNFNTSQGPILLFTTYSLLHKLADPDPSVFGGAIGMGFEGEYEFIIREVTEDRIDLVTRKQKRPVSLVKASREDWNQLEYNRQIVSRFEVNRELPFYQYIEVNGEKATFFYSQKLRMAYIAHPKENQTVVYRLPWESTPTSIRFIRPVTLGGVTFSEVTMNASKQLRIADVPGTTGTFSRATNRTDRCELRFPGAVEAAQKHDGYNLVERGVELDYITPPGHGIEYFRFYWNLVGYAAGELYTRNDQGIGLWAGLYTTNIVADGVGDQVTFTKHTYSQCSGVLTFDMNNWFSIVYFPGTLTNYLGNPAGLTVIPFGDQFYMVRNADNRQWALYSRKNMVE